MVNILLGHWFLSQCGVDDGAVFPRAKVMRALQTIYEKNVVNFCNGELGAVNGMKPDGMVDTHSIQSEETWTGTFKHLLILSTIPFLKQYFLF